MGTADRDEFTDDAQYQRLLRGLREARSAQLWDVRLNTRRAVQWLCARLERDLSVSVNHECERAALLRLAATVAEATGDAVRAGRWRGRFVAAQDHLARIGVAIDE